jgi:hypothetical protein
VGPKIPCHRAELAPRLAGRAWSEVIPFYAFPWVRGHWADALKFPDFSMGWAGRISGVCLCDGGVGRRI